MGAVTIDIGCTSHVRGDGDGDGEQCPIASSGPGQHERQHEKDPDHTRPDCQVDDDVVRIGPQLLAAEVDRVANSSVKWRSAAVRKSAGPDPTIGSSTNAFHPATQTSNRPPLSAPVARSTADLAPIDAVRTVPRTVPDSNPAAARATRSSRRRTDARATRRMPAPSATA